MKKNHVFVSIIGGLAWFDNGQSLQTIDVFCLMHYQLEKPYFGLKFSFLTFKLHHTHTRIHTHNLKCVTTHSHTIAHCSLVDLNNNKKYKSQRCWTQTSLYIYDSNTFNVNKKGINFDEIVSTILLFKNWTISNQNSTIIFLTRRLSRVSTVHRFS